MKSLLPATLRGIFVIVIFVLVSSFFIYHFNADIKSAAVTFYSILNDQYRFKKAVASFGPYSPLAFILLQVVQVVIAPIPGAPVGFLGGYLFGVKAGFIYSTIGLTVGSVLAFSIAGIFERWMVRKFVSSKKLKKFDYLMKHEGIILGFLLFLIPGFPKDALCYILGLTRMSLVFFLIISTVGRIPGTLIATLQGAQAFNKQYTLFFVLAGISALIALVFYVYGAEIHNMLKKNK